MVRRPCAGQQQAVCGSREGGTVTGLDAGPSNSHSTEAGPAADGSVSVVESHQLAVRAGPDEDRSHDIRLTADAGSSSVGSGANWLLHDADAIAVQATTEVDTDFCWPGLPTLACMPSMPGATLQVSTSSRRATLRNVLQMQARTVLRPVCAHDFDEALQEVSPSTNQDSTTMSELKQWNSTYGSSRSKAFTQKLSYFT